MSEYSDRRNERARALGFSSYSQQYRASRQGYTGQGTAYNAAMAAHRAPGVTRLRKANGALVLSAERGSFAQLLREARRAMK